MKTSGLAVRKGKAMGGLRLLRSFFAETKIILLYGLISIVTILWLPSYISTSVSLIMLTFFVIKQIRERPEVDLRSLVRSLISGSVPGYSTFMIVVLFVIYTSWLAEFLANGELDKALASFFFTVGIMPLYAIHITYSLGTETERLPKKILISALSKPSGRASFEELKEAYTKGEKALIELNEKKGHNWIPFLRLYLFHKDTLHKWFMLVSEKSQEEKFKEIIGEQEKIETYKTNFDDYNDISSKLFRILKEIRSEGYSDDDISVYISGGTSAVTLALTLFAVKDGRQVEYIRQDTREIVAINISFEDLYSFSPEER